jgi:hypothetical protein
MQEACPVHRRRRHPGADDGIGRGPAALAASERLPIRSGPNGVSRASGGVTTKIVVRASVLRRQPDHPVRGPDGRPLRRVLRRRAGPAAHQRPAGATTPTACGRRRSRSPRGPSAGPPTPAPVHHRRHHALRRADQPRHLPGRQRRSTVLQGRRRGLPPGRHHQLGHRLRRDRLPRVYTRLSNRGVGNFLHSVTGGVPVNSTQAA